MLTNTGTITATGIISEGDTNMQHSQVFVPTDIKVSSVLFSIIYQTIYLLKCPLNPI